MQTFKELEVGTRFYFKDIRAGSEKFNQQYGPFTKTAGRKYRTTDGAVHTVETITYKVVKA